MQYGWSIQREQCGEKKMPKLTVISGDIARDLPFSHGSTVRELLDASGLRVRSGCRGNGACGLCLVQIVSGNANGPTKNELLILSPEQIEQKARLACQLMPENDLCIRIINTISQSSWRDLEPGRLPCSPFHCIPSHHHHLTGLQHLKNAYGLAVDLGTTHISISLWDLKQMIRLSGRIGCNPQSCYGADVVTRLIAAGQSPENARKIAKMALDAVHEGLLDMCSRDGLDPQEVIRVAIVGNTPMLALLTRTDPQILLQPHFWTQPIDCRQDNTQPGLGVLGIHPDAAVEVVPPFAGFVGSDLLAGVIATRLTDRPGGLLIDFGTNSEMALWDGKTLWATSAAGGPAFESCQIQCGMPADDGSIYRVERPRNSGQLHFRVIGGGEAKGLCGSGLVDLIAILRSSGDLTRTGKFAMQYSKDGFVVQEKSPTIRLTGKDVDMIQRAKAAIGTGIKTLLATARMNAAELNRICVCGVFGRHLNIRNAQSIGLLPDVSPERVELCGNTALAGCECLLLSPTGATDLQRLRKRAAIINLAQVSDFDALFLENLYLQPLKVDET
jgi:uncharacterized 2Fe-2S/4Fe-4S cluster protein (DUF4445 family)